jgi:hypothetical protein
MSTAIGDLAQLMFHRSLTRLSSVKTKMSLASEPGAGSEARGCIRRIVDQAFEPP